MVKPLPPVEHLTKLLQCDPIAGRLVWRTRPREMFGSTAQFHRWNSSFAGAEAGRITAAGYRNLKIDGAGYQAHRIIWKMVKGVDPGELDHINRVKCDNRIDNLREVSRSVNMRNKPPSANNRSGHKHISWSKSLNRWVVQLMVPGKGQRQVAWEIDLQEAVRERNRLMVQYGYAPETDVA